MILPPDFLSALPEETRDRFLEHLILTLAGPGGYDGQLELDRVQLLKQLTKGDILIEQSDTEDETSFGLISRDQAQRQGYRPD